jgi:hypothetical protein
VALGRTDVSAEPGASFIRVTRIGELGTTQACVVVPCSSETSVLTRATRHNIPEDTILYSHHRENLKSYVNDVWRNTESSISLYPDDCIIFSQVKSNNDKESCRQI